MDFLTAVRTTGRAAKDIAAVVIRDVTEEDLRALGAVERGTTVPSIEKLRSSHHSLARVLSQGMTIEEAAAITGYTPSRIGTLRMDPAFQALETHYQRMIDDTFEKGMVDFAGRLSATATDALEVIHERILEKPDDVSMGTLVDVVKLGADRTGFGPATKQTTVTVNVQLAARLEAARRRVAEALPGITLENDDG